MLYCSKCVDNSRIHRWDDDVVFKNCARGEEERKVGDGYFLQVSYSLSMPNKVFKNPIRYVLTPMVVTFKHYYC